MADITEMVCFDVSSYIQVSSFFSLQMNEEDLPLERVVVWESVVMLVVSTWEC